MICEVVAMLKEYDLFDGREYWVTKDGRKLYPQDFEDRHLINTIRFIRTQAEIERRKEAAKQWLLIELGANHGGIDNHAIDQALKYMSSSAMRKYIGHESIHNWLMNRSKIYWLLYEEARYRGLNTYI